MCLIIIRANNSGLQEENKIDKFVNTLKIFTQIDMYISYKRKEVAKSIYTLITRMH